MGLLQFVAGDVRCCPGDVDGQHPAVGQPRRRLRVPGRHDLRRVRPLKHAAVHQRAADATAPPGQEGAAGAVAGQRHVESAQFRAAESAAGLPSRGSQCSRRLQPLRSTSVRRATDQLPAEEHDATSPAQPRHESRVIGRPVSTVDGALRQQHRADRRGGNDPRRLDDERGSAAAGLQPARRPRRRRHRAGSARVRRIRRHGAADHRARERPVAAQAHHLRPEAEQCRRRRTEDAKHHRTRW